MHKDFQLNWKSLPWKDFQLLTLHLAQNLIPECNFENYLKEGHKQDGIDILSSIDNNGKYVLIQCKNEQSLSKSQIESIIERFVSESFRSKASKFILATSADLQKPILKQFIIDTQQKLFSEQQIKFNCWDKSFLNEQLRGVRSIVQFYFGEEDADKHCFPLADISGKPINNPIPDFIMRKVCIFNETENPFNNVWQVRQREKFSLSDIIQSDRLTSKHLCLIADAYQGKSFLLMQTAWELERGPFAFRCLFIQVKSHNVKPLKDLLDSQFSFWKQIPFKDLVLFIDGLDEVPTDQFDRAVRNIADFRQAFPFISLIFSCRKLFYNHYKVRTTVKEFSTYELYPLQDSDVTPYLKNKLGALYDKFDKGIFNKGISHFLYHPFYLTTLVETFKLHPHKLPAGKIEVLERFIDNSYNISLNRRITGGKYLEHKIVKHRNTVQKFALALQLAGLNSFREEDVQTLFDDSERELLEHNSLISISAGRWSFTNALFQEHLAALKLAKMDISNILAHITVGNKIKKIKTKWIQTLSSLLSILDDDTPLRSKIFHFIETDNIELLFTAEKTKFTEEMRFQATKKLMLKCIKYDLRPMLVYEETIATFIDKDRKTMDFLLKKLEQSKVSERVKTSICYILKNLSSAETFENRILKLVIKEISKTADPYYARQLIEVLVAFHLGNASHIDIFIKNIALSSSHEFRTGLYNLILSLGLVDKFYYFGIDGMKHLINYNRDITHSGSEHSLVIFLLSTDQLSNVQLLFRKMTEEDWINYSHHHSMSYSDFLSRLTNKASEIFKKYPQITLSVANYINILNRRSLKDEFKEIDKFFVTTKSNNLAVRFLINKIMEGNNWELNNLITPDTFDYLLFEFEERASNTRLLWNWIHALRHSGANSVADAFLAQCDKVTEGALTSEIKNSSHDKYTKFEKEKRSNDIAYIQNVESLREGVLKFFEAYGKKSIPQEDVFVEYDGPEIRKKFDSNFIAQLLIRWVSQDKVVSLKKTLKVIDNPQSFEYFKAYEILHYNFLGTPEEESLKSILKNYYDTEIVSANFKNSIVQKDNRITWLRREKLLGEIFQKFKFATPQIKLFDFVWLDMEGIRSFQNQHYPENKRNSISEMIIEQLSENDLNSFRQQIVANIKSGIKCESVLGSHVALCMHLNIYDARDIIFEIINKQKIRKWTVSNYIDVYLHLGGDINKLVPYFKKQNDYTEQHLYFYLVDKLSATQKDIVKKSLLDRIESILVPGEIKIEAASLLMTLGINEGFLYLTSRLRTDKKAPFSIQGRHKASNIDTVFGLNQIKDLMYMVLDPKYTDNMRFHDSAKSILLEWLNHFAEKSEYDLNIVTNFLNESYEKLNSIYSNANDLFWYVEKMVEKFRDSDKTTKSVDEIKLILDAI